jgi:NAD+ diphosphatase
MQTYSNTHPANILSYCPRCGQKDFKFNGIKKFTCPACNFTFFINASTAVTVILQAPDGKIILTKRRFDPNSGFYDLPGGFVDIGESAEEAAKREIFEELGIKIDDLKYLISFPNEYAFEGISYFTCDLAFTSPVENLSGLKPADDVSDVLAVHPEEIDFDAIAFPSILNILKFYINRL